MRIVAFSDTHNRHKKIQIPEGDVLIHAGDFTTVGRVNEIEDFIKWMKTLPHKYKVLVPGNHDRGCENQESYWRDIANPIIFCSNGTVGINNLTILCYSMTSAIPNGNTKWAYTYEKGDPSVSKFWSYAPPCDVLVTHGPPKGVLDRVTYFDEGEDPEVGDADCLSYVIVNKPKVHIFGHIHESYGQKTLYDTDFYNVSICTLKYEPINPVTVIDL